MPPTIQTNSRHDSRQRASGDKRSELVCRVKYNNTLPDIPFDPKFISYPFDSNRYVQYTQSTLEKNFKFDLLTEHDLGVPIDLINPDTYLNFNTGLDSEDEHLLDDEANTAADSKRSRHHNKSVSWLRKTEYISTEYNRFTQSAQKAEARVGYNIKKQMKEDVLYKDRESQIKAINETFDLAKRPITQHYSKPGVYATDVFPVFPDFEMWKHPCAQVIFDSDPAQKGKTMAAQMEEMSQAMIRGMVDESGDQFVAYFLPTPETLEKRRLDAEGAFDSDGEEYDYVLAREYNWNVKNKASRGYEENYFFVMKDDGVYYNELETRVRLSKRRKVGPGGQAVAKSRLIVRHRPLADQEIAAQDARVMMLEPPGEEDDLDFLQHPDGENDARNRRGGEDSPVSKDSDDERGSVHSNESDVGGARRKRRTSDDDEDVAVASKRSRSRSHSRSRSRSMSGSRSRSHSRSRSRSPSRSRSGSQSPNRSRSRSGSQSRSRSGSPELSPRNSFNEKQNDRDIFGSDDSN